MTNGENAQGEIRVTTDEADQSEMSVINAENDQNGSYVKKTEIAENEKREREAYLYKWLMRMFWLSVLNALVSVFSDVAGESGSSVLSNISTLCNCLCFIAALLLLFMISKKEKIFYSAAVGGTIAGIMCIISWVLERLGKADAGALFFLFYMIAVLVATRLEANAYRKCLTGENGRLSRLWIMVWWWNLGGLICWFVILALIPQTETAYPICNFVFEIVFSAKNVFQTVLHYRTAKAFKQDAQKEESSMRWEEVWK